MAIQLGKKEEQVKYYYSINGTQFGPYDLAMLLSKIDSAAFVSKFSTSPKVAKSFCLTRSL